MRTTLKLDDDVVAALKPILKRPNSKFKRVINELLRQSLGIAKKSKKVKIQTYSMGLRAGLDPVNLNKLLDEVLVEDSLKS